MENEQMTIHDNDAVLNAANDAIETDNFEPCDNVDDVSENDAVVTTSNNTMENHDFNDETVAAEEIIEIKPTIVQQESSGQNNKNSGRKSGKKKRRTKKYSYNPKRYKCDQCNYTNAFESRMKTHAQVHNSEKPFECEECHERFGYMHNLRVHLNKIHGMILL